MTELVGRWEFDDTTRRLTGVVALPRAYIEFGGDAAQVAELCRRLGELAQEKGSGDSPLVKYLRRAPGPMGGGYYGPTAGGYYRIEPGSP